MRHFLLADDEQHKLDKLSAFIYEHFPDAQIRIARSVKSTLRAVSEESFDVLLLDMSLPTFDVAAGEAGGRPQGFGGIEVLRFLDYKKVRVPVLVVTQYEAFKDEERLVNLDELREKLASSHSPNFVDCLYFAPLSNAWRIPLLELLSKVRGSKSGLT